MPPASPSRRDALAGMLAALAGTALADEPPADRRPKGLKLSCSSLAFSDMGWEEALAEIRKLGFRRADLAMFEGWTHLSPSKLTDPEGHARAIVKACERLEVEPVSLHANFRPPGARDFPGLTSPDREARAIVLDHFRRVATCAGAAGIPLVNVQPGKFVAGVSRRVNFGRAADLLKDMQAFAQKKKVTLSFENHTGSVGERPADALALLEKVDGLRIDLDLSHVVANSLKVEDVRPLFPYVAHAGVRNARPGSFNEPVRPGGKLDFPLETYVDALRKASVNAHLSVEYYEPKMRPHIAPLKAALEKAGVRG